ncbi:MAG TPA: hypothetical protein VKB58_07260 [Terriglobales bacterium]|jgi:hypothetical protein|nr:hypothetical protein [Terriglobales bacterium]
MAELKRKDEQLTTADLAGREAHKEVREAEVERPKPVRSETESRLRENAQAAMLPRAAQPTGDPTLRDSSTPAGMPQQATREMNPTPLFSENDVTDLRARWSNVQTGFVDEPRHAVEEADKLVAAVMKRLAEGFATERSNLEKQWDRGDNVSTEDLRVAFQRYRSFFDRLLNA